MFATKKSKIILAIIIFLIIMVGVVAAVILLNNQLKKPKAIVKSVTKYDDVVEVMEKAGLEKNPSYCDQLKVADKDYCLYFVATNNNNLAICNLISDPAQAKKCSEIIVSQQIMASQDPKKCLSLTVAEIKNDCLSTIFRQQNDLNYCQGFDQEIKSLCEDIINTNLAFKAKDRTICDKIQSADNKINCESALATIPKDSDGDGVPDYLERAYGTDPFNPKSK